MTIIGSDKQANIRQDLSDGLVERTGDHAVGAMDEWPGEELIAEEPFPEFSEPPPTRAEKWREFQRKKRAKQRGTFTQDQERRLAGLSPEIIAAEQQIRSEIHVAEKTISRQREYEFLVGPIKPASSPREEEHDALAAMLDLLDIDLTRPLTQREEELLRAGRFIRVRKATYVCGLCLDSGLSPCSSRIAVGALIRWLPHQWNPDCIHRGAHFECVQQLIQDIFLTTGTVVVP